MKKRIIACLVMALTCLMTWSCGTVEEFVLLNDLDVDAKYRMQEAHELKIKRGDELTIVVTHKLPQLTQMFNQKLNDMENGETYVSYLVNNDGYINYPHFDTIKVTGLTCAEAEKKITGLIEGAGLATNPLVTVKIKEFKVTVIGEVGTGVYTFDKEYVTIFDLMAKANLIQGNANLAGGVPIRRDKILVMRENNGELQSEYISLLSKDILYSPYYYLQQNDIIYVWPSQTTIRRSNGLFDFWWSRLSVLTTAVSVVTLFVTLFSKKN